MGKKGLLAMRPKGLTKSQPKSRTVQLDSGLADHTQLICTPAPHGPLHMMYIPYFSNAFVQFSMLQQLGVQWTPF